MTIINWLQTWYEKACDGTWEHSHGVRIDTLDNPGWHVRIDLRHVAHSNVAVREINVENGENDWLRCSIQGETFEAYGDLGKLERILEIFKEWEGGVSDPDL